MAMEVSCGQCQGRLLIETPGVVVACPHCGVHLSVPVLDCENPFQAAGESPIVTVGFNRRFAPATIALKNELGTGPCAVHCRVNAGSIPASSWVQESDEGGGRVVGEVCHFVDLIHALSGGLTTSVSAVAMEEPGETSMEDTLSITLSLDNGSIGQILYAANGDKSFARERVEVFRSGSVGVIDNFRSYGITRAGRTKTSKSLSLDRGHRQGLQAFLDGIRTAQPPVPMTDYRATTEATFAILKSLRNKTVVGVGCEREASPCTY